MNSIDSWLHLALGLISLSGRIPFYELKPVRIKPCEPVSRWFTAWNQDAGVQ